MALLEITNLCVDFPARRQTYRAVDSLDLCVEAGEIHGLVGESGAGKSTVGAAILGLLEPPGVISGGQIEFQGERISGLDAETMRSLRGRKISMIFQDPLTSLNPLFTVRQQLTETIISNLGVSPPEADARALELLQQVGIPGPEIRIDHYPHQFSGGMRQRVVIALALCSEPDVIIADEPTTALDVAVQARILDLIRDLIKVRNVGVILITHDMGVISDVTDRVTVMYQGKVVETGPTAKVLGRPEHPYTQSLIAAVPRPDKPLKRFPRVQFGDRNAPFVVADLQENWTRPIQNPDVDLIQVQNLSKRFLSKRSILPWLREYFTAVDDVSFNVRSGEIFGLVGESGSGKSTVARLIAGLHYLDAGTVRYAGEIVSEPRNQQVRRAFRQKIQMIFQDPFSSLNPRIRVDNIVAEPMIHHRLASGKEARDRAVFLLEKVGLGAAAALKYPHEFSGGQRQRISIARALATQPEFLICDEPTSALDVSIQAQILNILKDIRDHLGLTILFISHDLPVVRQMCDRVAVMRGGKVVESQSTDDLFTNPDSSYTRELLDLMPKLDGLAATEGAVEPT